MLSTRPSGHLNVDPPGELRIKAYSHYRIAGAIPISLRGLAVLLFTSQQASRSLSRYTDWQENA